MRTVIVKDNQTLYDIALQHCGTVNAVVDIADFNQLDLNGNALIPGNSIVVPDVINEPLFNFYKSKNIVIANKS